LLSSMFGGIARTLAGTWPNALVESKGTRLLWNRSDVNTGKKYNILIGA